MLPQQQCFRSSYLMCMPATWLVGMTGFLPPVFEGIPNGLLGLLKAKQNGMVRLLPDSSMHTSSLRCLAACTEQRVWSSIQERLQGWTWRKGCTRMIQHTCIEGQECLPLAGHQGRPADLAYKGNPSHSQSTAIRDVADKAIRGNCSQTCMSIPKLLSDLGLTTS